MTEHLSWWKRLYTCEYEALLSDDRNPMFIPAATAPVAKGCPKCGNEEYEGRRSNGQIVFKCKCGNVWYGGLPQPDAAISPIHNQQALPPSAAPLITTVKNPKTGEETEIRKRQDLTQEFRKGTPLPDGDE